MIRSKEICKDNYLFLTDWSPSNILAMTYQVTKDRFMGRIHIRLYCNRDHELKTSLMHTWIKILRLNQPNDTLDFDVEYSYCDDFRVGKLDNVWIPELYLNCDNEADELPVEKFKPTHTFCFVEPREIFLSLRIPRIGILFIYKPTRIQTILHTQVDLTTSKLLARDKIDTVDSSYNKILLWTNNDSNWLSTSLTTATACYVERLLKAEPYFEYLSFIAQNKYARKSVHDFLKLHINIGPLKMLVLYNMKPLWVPKPHIVFMGDYYEVEKFYEIKNTHEGDIYFDDMLLFFIFKSFN